MATGRNFFKRKRVILINNPEGIQMLRYILYTHLLFFISIKAYAQRINETNFRLFTTKEGLSHNYVAGIIQDSSGYIWVATRRGLNRFDGSNFKQFLRNTRYNAIPDNSIYSMKLFGSRLAIATEDGAQIISTNKLEHKNLYIPTTDALQYWSNSCLYVHRDNNDNYGVSTKTGLYIFSATGKLKKRYDRYTEKDIGHSWMLFGKKMFSLPDGNMLQQTSEGFLFYDRKNDQIKDLTNSYPHIRKLIPKLKSFQLLSVSANDLLIINHETNSFDLVDMRNGNTKSFPSCIPFSGEFGWQTNLHKLYNDFWALNSANDGFFLLHIDTTSRKIVCSPTKYFSRHNCNIIFSDREKRLWVGTNVGLYMETLHSKIIESFPIHSKTEEQISINYLLFTADKIFAGTDRKEILILDKSTKEIVHRVSLPAIPQLSNIITYMMFVHPDTLWIGSSSGLSWLNVKNYSYGPVEFTTGFDVIQFLFVDSKKNRWIIPNKVNSIFYYNKEAQQMRNVCDTENPLFRVNCAHHVAEDKEGNIWFSGDAIARWNSKLEKIDTLIEFLPSQKNRKKGFSVMTDSKGEIWVALNDDGFAKITNSELHVRPENLAIDNSSVIQPILLNDKIFISTSNGIGCLDLQSYNGIVFHYDDGFPREPITSTYFSIDPTDQSTWFACKNIICRIPSRAGNIYRRPPVLKLNEIFVLNDTAVNYPQNLLVLKHNQNDIKLSFSAINFTDPENIRFAYRIMNKKDTSWIETGSQSNILLTNISPGGYKIEVKAYAYDNKWPEQKAAIEIQVRRPFWQTSVFLTATPLLLAGIFYTSYRRRIKQVQQKANLDKLLAQTEMKALHSQMNPHFIFNCLNSIREMILNNENEQASVYLSKFARLIRITLNQSSKSFVSLKETIDYLQRYIEMEKIRISHFTYSIDIGKDLHPEEIMLPPMLIQPFIENAIWHGASPKKNMQINISFQKKGNELICIVEDNGIGIGESLKNKENAHHEQSVGISNIRQRIGLLNEKYKLQSTVRIEDKSCLAINNGTGTIVTLCLPIKPNDLTQWNI